MNYRTHGLIAAAFTLLLSVGYYVNSLTAPDLTITPINGIPSTVVESTTINGLTYNIHNNSAGTINVTYNNLNSNGITYTTTCGALTAGSTCGLTLTFAVPTLPAGKTSDPYIHTAQVLGGVTPTLLPLNSLIVKSSTSLAPTTSITLSDATTCSGTYTVTFTGSDGVAHEYDTVPCGTNTLSPSLPQSVYTAHITPSSTEISGNTYDAPVDFHYNLAKAGDTANFVYQLDQSISVQTNLTMPNVGSATSAITCTGTPGTYGPHSQGAGSTTFDAMKPGSYTCTAANYTGTDSETYIASPTNPYVISSGAHVIAMTFTAQAPSTQHVHTNITAPNLPAGQTVAITLADGGHTYGPHNQASGNTPFDTMLDATDYTLTCANYTVGPDTYACTPNDPYTVSPSETVINIIYSKKAPPGANYDWKSGHLAEIKAANVGAVIWGGGSTTGPIYIGSNPPANTQLVSTIETYEGSPTPLQSTAQIKLFPNYIAMGSVSQFSPDVTDQFKAQHLDVDNHYEGNGDANASCLFLQQNANGASGGNQVDYYYIANVAKDLQPFNWTTTPSPTNLVPAGTYVVSGDQFRAAVIQGYQNYNAKIGTPIQVDSTHITIPITYTSQPVNTEQDIPIIANNGTVTFSVPTNISTNITYPAGPSLPVSSITSTGGVATVVVNNAAGHGLFTGQMVSISGATQSQYNGRFTATVTGATTFTYPVSGSPASPATGTITMAPIESPASGTSEIDLAENMCGGFYYPWGGYAPQIDNIATQAAAVKTANSHTLIAGSVFYTTRFSDGGTAIQDDISNPYSVTSAFFNLMYEAQRMEYQYTTNGVPMVLLLNPDSTWLFQNCQQYYCPLSWKPNITSDKTTVLLANPNMQAAIFTALDKMQSEGYLTSGEVTSLKADFISKGILTPTGGRTVPGIPEYMLAVNWAVKNVAPHIPFGQGNNIYDSTNPLLLPAYPGGGTAPYQTSSALWVHKVNHLGYSSEQVQAAVLLQGQRYANYLKDMNFAGNSAGDYKPDFYYFDKYERDEIVNYIGTADNLPHPDGTYVDTGYEFNGVDFDTYVSMYIADIVANANPTPLPVILWQMPGSQLYTSVGTIPSKVGTYTAPASSVTGSSGVATITMPSAHGVSVGDSISVQYGIPASYNGNFTVTSVPSATTFTYAQATLPVTGLTSTGGVASATVSQGHGLATGDKVYISGAAQSEYNGTFTVTNTGITTFTYPISGSPASPATGTITMVQANTPAVPAPGVPAIVIGGLPGTQYWGSSTPTWVFGDTTLNNDLSNLNYNLGISSFLFTPQMNASVYFTKNSNISNNEEYLKLTSASP